MLKTRVNPRETGRQPAYGPGGKSSNANKRVSIFGATGFLGSYVTEKLGHIGSTVYVANRGCEMETRKLKVAFDLGNFAQVFYSPRDEDSVRECIAHSDIVINMIGKSYETGNAVPTRRANGELSAINYSTEEVHSEIPGTLARIAKEEGCEKFIHVSAAAAHPESRSRLMRAKAAGDAAVLQHFPSATIVKPTILFGAEDKFLNWYGYTAKQFYGNCIVVEDGKALVQPVWAPDVAEAIRSCVLDDTLEGKTLALGGDHVFSRKECAQFVIDVTQLDAWIVDTPEWWARKIAGAVNLLPNPRWTPDQIDELLVDQTLAQAPADAVTFADLGIKPVLMEKQAWEFLQIFRPHSKFIETKGYHVEYKGPEASR